MPLLFLLFLVTDLFSVAYIFIGYYLFRQWYRFHNTASDEYAQYCFYGAIALSMLILFGRILLKRLMSSRRGKVDSPHMFTPLKADILHRPDGSTINIEYYGREGAQPIVFVHGWNANLKNWYYQKQYFEKEYRLIMIDLPGLGKSKKASNNDFSLTKMAADLSAVLQHAKADNAILWGHSFGGMTILTLLTHMRHVLPLHVKGVILEHTTYTNPVKTTVASRLMTALQKPLLEPLCWVLIALSPIIWISKWMSYLNGNAHLTTRLLTFTGTQTTRQLDFCTLLSTLSSPSVLARGMLAMFRYDVTAQLSSIPEKTLIIAANKDRLTNPRASQLMASTIPNAQLVTVAPGGHQSLLERHRDVNAAAAEFISTL